MFADPQVAPTARPLFCAVFTAEGAEVRSFPTVTLGMSVGPMTRWEAERIVSDYTQLTGILPTGLEAINNV